MVTKEQFMIVYNMIQEGRYNMFSAEARINSGLPEGVYKDALSNYGKYKDMYVER